MYTHIYIYIYIYTHIYIYTYVASLRERQCSELRPMLKLAEICKVES